VTAFVPFFWEWRSEVIHHLVLNLLQPCMSTSLWQERTVEISLNQQSNIPKWHILLHTSISSAFLRSPSLCVRLIIGLRSVTELLENVQKAWSHVTNLILYMQGPKWVCMISYTLFTSHFTFLCHLLTEYNDSKCHV